MTLTVNECGRIFLEETMNIQELINGLSLKEKISQMFIMGFEGTEPTDNILQAVKSGLGGVIFFANNIISAEQFRILINTLQDNAEIPLFTSIDQEGGLVERTINIENKIDYLPPMALSATGKTENVEKQTAIMSEELKFYGINMDFAPVLDVNTNPENPIIGVRSFGETAEEVSKFSEPVYEVLKQNGIVAVGKHFPGHGEAWVDSHLDLPFIDLPFKELEDIHVKPFKNAIDNGLDAVMAAHVHYSAFNSEIVPASLSKEIITDYLKQKLGFKGLIITDDMDMGGIINHYSKNDACIKAINAGVDMLIVRNSKDSDLNIIEEVASAVKNNIISMSRIDEAVYRIFSIKQKYGILNKTKHQAVFNPDKISEYKEIIEQIAKESIRVIKAGSLIPIDQTKKTALLRPDQSEIFNYSRDHFKFSDCFNNIQEITYSLNPDKREIKSINERIEDASSVIFLSYNAIFNKRQLDLFDSINKPIVAVSCGVPYDMDYFNKANTIINVFSLRTISLKALSTVLTGKLN